LEEKVCGEFWSWDCDRDSVKAWPAENEMKQVARKERRKVFWENIS